MKRFFISTLIAALFLSSLCAQDIVFPEPDKEGGQPLMKTMQLRHTSREFSSEKLPARLMSNLFWAACGATNNNHRTVPSARNYQEVKAYAVMEEGVYVYSEKEHSLKKLIDGDFRQHTGVQDFVKNAPLVIVLVADHSKMGGSDELTRIKYSWADAAFISQNIYLFCASESLNTGVRALIDREELSKKMQLREDQEIVLAQCVGYPVK